MKAFIFIALASVLLGQFTIALPRLPRSVEDTTEKTKIRQYAQSEVNSMITGTVNSYRILFDAVIEAAQKSELNLEEELNELAAFSRAVKELKNIEYIDSRFRKTLELFNKSRDILDKYDLKKIENPTENQKAIAKFFDDNGIGTFHLEYLARISTMRERFLKHFQQHIDAMAPAERQRESKFIAWFDKFKEVDSLEKVYDSLFVLH